MRQSLRFVLPLMLVLAGIDYAVTPLIDRLTLSWLVRNLDIWASLIVNTIRDPLRKQLEADRKIKVVKFLNQPHHPGRAALCCRLLRRSGEGAIAGPLATSRTPVRHRRLDRARETPAGKLPIVLRVEHHEPREVYEYFRASDRHFVNSLHDGMNLVAEEFISAHDERGGLVLSQFMGADRELPEAFIVNPYGAEQCAAALSIALAIPPEAQRNRLRIICRLVAELNVYRSASRMLLDAIAIRHRNCLLDKAGRKES